MAKATKSESGSTSAIASNGQERLWYQCKLQQPAYSYNEQLEVLVHGKLRIDALETVFESIVKRHEALRTVFKLDKQEQLQQIVLPPFTVSIPVIKVGDSKNNLQTLINDQCLKQGQAIYDLSSGPLFRIAVLQLPDNKQLFLFSFHHIIMDGRAVVILLKEINQLYQQLVTQDESLLSKTLLSKTLIFKPLPFQLSDFALQEKTWLHSKALKRQLEYWAQQLKNLPPILDIPLDRSRPLVPRSFGAWQSVRIDKKCYSDPCQHQLETACITLYCGTCRLQKSADALQQAAGYCRWQHCRQPHRKQHQRLIGLLCRNRPTALKNRPTAVI